MMRREKGKQKNSVALFVFILSTLRIVFQRESLLERKNSAENAFVIKTTCRHLLFPLKVFVAHSVYDK